MSDAQWILFWLAWSIGGLAFVAILLSKMPNDPPSHWGAAHAALLIIAAGPIMWAAMLVVLIERRR